MLSSTEILSAHLSIAVLLHNLPYSYYAALRNFLDIPYCRYKRQHFYYTPLLIEIYSCLPKQTGSLIFSMLNLWKEQVLIDLSIETQKYAQQIILESPDMKEQLTIAFVNYHIRPCSPCIPAPESSSYISSEVPIEQKKVKNQISPLLSDILSEKLSNLLLKVRAGKQ